MKTKLTYHRGFLKLLLFLSGYLIIQVGNSTPNYHFLDKARIFFPITGHYLPGEIKSGFHNSISGKNSSKNGISQVSDLQVLSIVNVQCNGTQSGSVTLSFKNGDGKIYYSLDGGTYKDVSQSPFTIANVGAGNHQVSLSDNANNPVSVSFSIAEPSLLSIVASATPITCNGQSTISISASGGKSPYTGTGNFKVSSGTYTYMVTDANGCTASATITPDVIADTEKPSVKAPGNYGLLNDPGQCGRNIYDIGTPVVSDNCGIASITNDHPSSFYPVGTTTVTWIVKDHSGNVNDTAKQLITVIDNEMPVINVTNFTVTNNPGICGANVTLPQPVTSDNCGIASITNNHPSTFYPIGNTTVTWTVTDKNGWVKSKGQTITVTDNEKPVISQMNTQFLCANASNTYSLPPLTVTDNCGIASISYNITGATNRSGTGNNAGGIFNPGTSTIAWLVTDVNGNTQTSNTQVIVNPQGPTPVITASKPDDFCNLLTLTASSSSPGTQYDWFLGGVPLTRTNTIYLGLEDTDGMYSVSNVNTGCPSATVAYQYIKQNQVSNYTLVSSLKTTLGQYNVIESGSAGVLAPTGVFEINSNSSVASYGAFVKAKKITKIGNNITLGGQILDAANGMDLPSMLYNTANTSKLGTATVNQNVTTTLTGNYRTLTLKQGANVTLQGNTFGTIKLEPGVTLTFTTSLLNIETLQVLGSNSLFTNVKFAPNTKVLVGNSVSIGNMVNINPDKYRVTLYLGDTKSDSESFTLTASIANITANVYLPLGKMKIFGINGANPVNNNISMMGLFIAQFIESYTKVSWNSYSCYENPSMMSSRPQPIVSNGLAATENVVPNEVMEVKVMPNPTQNYFRILLRSKFDLPVSLRVLDASGRVVESKSGIGANSTIEIGHNYGMGTYFAEMIQGEYRKTIQLIKVRG